MDALLSIGLGVGLSAACGFRVFVPPLVMSVAALGGYLHLSPGFEWIGTVPALIVFATATVVEVMAYAIPWLDHLLDTLATPAAMVAAMLASASVVTDLPPALRWGIAVITGGAAAGVVQGSTVLLRLHSTAATAGIGNPFLSLAEFIGAVVTAILAIACPLVSFVLVLTACFLLLRLIARRRTGQPPAAPPRPPQPVSHDRSAPHAE